jgi:hypothetical protein
LEQPISPTVTMLARADGLYRLGNAAASSPVGDGSSVARGTLGTLVTIERNLRLKASTELYRFSDADSSGKKLETALHLGAVGVF